MTFACYRMPYADEFVRVEQRDGAACQLASPAELDGREGFVVAPFVVSADCPLLLIRPDIVTRHRVDEELGNEEGGTRKEERRKRQLSREERASYHDSFELFHRELQKGQFRKIVLARRSKETFGEDVDAEQLFLKACKSYPRMFVALVSTPESGMWLMATPEVLVQEREERGERREEKGKATFHTMALAGTMALHGRHLTFDTPPGIATRNTPASTPEWGQKLGWTDKNIEEQRFVATYILERLKQLADDIEEQGPRTVRAGNLVHLRSDFLFTLREGKGLGALLEALHPTPAVCGVPKDVALDFILKNEPSPRRYYSGFCGPLNLHTSADEQAAADTSLFVSLRCMQIDGRTCMLYAGGGLLKESEEQQEWEETEAKMQTMRSLF